LKKKGRNDMKNVHMKTIWEAIRRGLRNNRGRQCTCEINKEKKFEEGLRTTKVENVHVK